MWRRLQNSHCMSVPPKVNCASKPNKYSVFLDIFDFRPLKNRLQQQFHLPFWKLSRKIEFAIIFFLFRDLRFSFLLSFIAKINNENGSILLLDNCSLEWIKWNIYIIFSGNYAGVRPLKTGAPCSDCTACGHSCENGLCTRVRWIGSSLYIDHYNGYSLSNVHLKAAFDLK